jgi:hypothetical protein
MCVGPPRSLSLHLHFLDVHSCALWCDADSPLATLKSTAGPLAEVVSTMAAAKNVTPAQLVRAIAFTANLLRHW